MRRESLYCPICGSELLENNNFCAKCGKNVTPVSSIDQVIGNALGEPKTMISKATGLLVSFVIGLAGFVVGNIAGYLVFRIIGSSSESLSAFLTLGGGIVGLILFKKYLTPRDKKR